MVSLRLLPRLSLSSPACQHLSVRCSSLSSSSSPGVVQPPNVVDLCEKARIRLSPKEIEEFSPQISKVVDWFSQLQDVDLENVEPVIRVGGAVDGDNPWRQDVPVVFQDRDAMLASLPDREGPYLKVPKILKGSEE